MGIFNLHSNNPRTGHERGAGAVELAVGLPVMMTLLGYGLALVLLAGSVSQTVDIGIQTSLGIAAGNVSEPEDASAEGIKGYVIPAKGATLSAQELTARSQILSSDVGADPDAARKIKILAQIASTRGAAFPGDGSSSHAAFRLRQPVSPYDNKRAKFEIRYYQPLLGVFGINLITSVFSEMQNNTKAPANGRVNQMARAAS